MPDLISLKNFLFQKSTFLLLLYFFFFVLQFFRGHHGKPRDNFQRAFVNGLLTILTALPISILFSQIQDRHFRNSGSSIPIWVQFLFLLLFLDFVSYLWHRANHRFNCLWRFHLWHHLETHLETTTALRFHSGELLLGGLLRLGALWFFPLEIEAILLFEVIYQGFNFFQHSNIDIGPSAEFWISKLFVTPGLHRVHHSMESYDRDKNFGTIFSFWDRFFKSFRWNFGVTRTGEQEESSLGSRTKIWWRAWLVFMD